MQSRRISGMIHAGASLSAPCPRPPSPIVPANGLFFDGVVAGVELDPLVLVLRGTIFDGEDTAGSSRLRFALACRMGSRKAYSFL